MPPKKQTIATTDAQPATAARIAWQTIAQMMPAKLASVTKKPNVVTRRSGRVERLVIPSSARASIFFKG